MDVLDTTPWSPSGMGPYYPGIFNNTNNPNKQKFAAPKEGEPKHKIIFGLKRWWCSKCQWWELSPTCTKWDSLQLKLVSAASNNTSTNADTASSTTTMTSASADQAQEPNQSQSQKKKKANQKKTVCFTDPKVNNVTQSSFFGGF